MDASWYFTAPWDPVPIRRGDALGLRAGADYFAELIAPGLSNASSDARWITLLSWCLKWSHIAWQNAGGGDLARRDEQRARYAWLRPLELLWVDRTLESGQTSGQLRGRRSLDRWRKANRNLPNFAMSPDQFRRYRQVGTYGAYRVMFRTVSGLTTGNDGWTPDATALKLADLVNDSLPSAVRLKQERFENGIKWGHWINDEASYWVKRGWSAAWEQAGKGLLPTPDDKTASLLPDQERSLLKPALFGDDSVRLLTAETLASAKSARSHPELCEALASSDSIAKKIAPESLAPLPAFTRLADAAMDAMRALWAELNRDQEAQAPGVQKLVRSAELKLKLEQLHTTSEAWLKAPGRSAFPHAQVADQLAEAMRGATSPLEQLRALAKHHDQHGGGRRWFREQAGKLVPLVSDTGIAASDYRFRLRSICLLAAQCGVADMQPALKVITQERPEDDGELL
mgnify:FL=1|jgi:hypothetical protein